MTGVGRREGLIMREFPLLAALTAALALAGAAQAQTIQLGQTVSGRITADDPQLNGRRYDCWVFDVPAGYYVIEQRSEELDAKFAVGIGRDCTASGGFEESYGGRFNGLNRRNQDAYSVFLTDGGPRFIRAQSGELYQGDAAYELTLTTVEAMRAPTTRTLEVGQTQTGRISADDPPWTDGVPSDCWAFQAPPGRYVARLRTTAFDGVLTVGRGHDCRRGRVTDSLPNIFPVPPTGGAIDLAFEAGGEPWYIAVHTNSREDRGEYRLTLVPRP
jgi:hypothetical protein